MNPVHKALMVLGLPSDFIQQKLYECKSLEEARVLYKKEVLPKIVSQYRKKVHQYHPDVCHDEDAGEKIKNIIEAKRIIDKIQIHAVPDRPRPTVSMHVRFGMSQGIFTDSHSMWRFFNGSSS